MAAFETLAEAAQAHGLAPEAVLQDIHGAVERTTQLQVSTRGPKGRADRRRTHDT